MEYTEGEQETIQQDSLHCPECHSTRSLVDETTGDQICTDCGAVIDDRIIDRGQEWRAFSTEERAIKSRVGSPTTLRRHDKGLSTTIDPRDRDSYGRRLRPKLQKRMYRLRRWDRRSKLQTSDDRNLIQAFNELDRLSSQLRISRMTRETIALIYRKTLEQHLSRGRSIQALVAACIYAAARIRNLPITLKDISKHSKVSKKEIASAYRVLITELELKVPPPNPIAYIPRFATMLNLSGACQRKAVEILRAAKQKKLTVGKDPKGIAAAALYLAAILVDERVTQHDIAKTASMTDVTVRNRYKDLVRQLELPN